MADTGKTVINISMRENFKNIERNPVNVSHICRPHKHNRSLFFDLLVRVQVRIGPPYPLVSRKRRLNGDP